MYRPIAATTFIFREKNRKYLTDCSGVIMISREGGAQNDMGTTYMYKSDT